jgi:2,3-bisphosphoglycerate-independent phosphoglycerate mutase
LELIDEFIVRPVVKYFQQHPDELGGVLIAPDHFTNHSQEVGRLKRIEVHSLDPVPFALWNGHERDAALYYSEDDVLVGKYAAEPVSHLDLLQLLGVEQSSKYKTKVC